MVCRERCTTGGIYPGGRRRCTLRIWPPFTLGRTTLRIKLLLLLRLKNNSTQAGLLSPVVLPHQ